MNISDEAIREVAAFAAGRRRDAFLATLAADKMEGFLSVYNAIADFRASTNDESSDEDWFYFVKWTLEDRRGY